MKEKWKMPLTDSRECRTCLELVNSASIISVQAKVTNENNVLEAIDELTSLKGSTDDFFPQYVCRKCFKLLKSTVIFRRLIISSNASFKEKQSTIDQNKNKDFNINDVQFTNEGNESGTSIDSVKIENSLAEIHGNLALQNKINEELKTETEKEFFENDEPSIFMEENQEDVPLENENEFNFTKENNVITKKSKIIYQICSLCGKTVKGKQNYNAHMKTHNSSISPLVFICPVCPKQFSQKKYLLVHRRSHTGEKPFHCDICNKNFSQFASFYVHKRRLHDKVVQGTCSYCGKKFVDKPELDVHIKMWHTGERPYLCEFCSATFVCNRTLQRHRRELHSEKKPCQKCGKMLGDYALKKHLIRHQVLEEGLQVIRKKFTCEYCKTVMNFTSRRRHLEKQHGIKLYGRGDDCKEIPIKETSNST